MGSEMCIRDSIGTGLIGFAQIGIQAYFYGAQLAIFVSAVMGLVSLVAICWRWPQIIADQAYQE